MQCRPPIYIVSVLDNTSRIIPVARTLVFDEHATHNLLACSLITGDVIQEGIVLFWRICIAALGFGVEEADGTRLQSDDEIHIETTFPTTRIRIRQENTTPNPVRTSSFSMTSLPRTKDARPSLIPSVPSQKSSPSPSR